jgi:hypothetical protein
VFKELPGRFQGISHDEGKQSVASLLMAEQ